MTVKRAEIPRSLDEEFPATGRILMYGIEYEIDLEACREHLALRAVELRGENPTASGYDLVAQAAGVNRKTLTRFLTEPDKVSVGTFADIITRGLKVDVDQVAKRVERQPA